MFMKIPKFKFDFKLGKIIRMFLSIPLYLKNDEIRKNSHWFIDRFI